MPNRARALIVVTVLSAAGCAEDRVGDVPWRDAPLVTPQPHLQVPAPLAAAHCTIVVDGIGEIDMEDDYLPHVIQCENGGAGPEALKAQAIAARSVAYYAIETGGSICDGQGCQVYSCGADPGPEHHAAVDATSGVYTSFNNTLTYAFFVAGDSGASAPSCVGSDGAASTEHWVTYNQGKTGDAVEQTALGYVFDPGDSGYGQNRGCMGQWSARCLENDLGYDSTAIMQFFYGMDIGLTQASGACVLPLGDDSGGGTTDPIPGTTGQGESTGGPLDGTTSVGPGSTGEGGPGSSDDGLGDGTAAGGSDDESGPALPDTFGEMAGDAGGCGCRSPGRGAAPWLVLPATWLARRRRRAR